MKNIFNEKFMFYYLYKIEMVFNNTFLEVDLLSVGIVEIKKYDAEQKRLTFFVK